MTLRRFGSTNPGLFRHRVHDRVVFTFVCRGVPILHWDRQTLELSGSFPGRRVVERVSTYKDGASNVQLQLRSPPASPASYPHVTRHPSLAHVPSIWEVSRLASGNTPLCRAVHLGVPLVVLDVVHR